MRRFLFFLFVISSFHVSAQIQLSTKSKKATALYLEADNYRVRGQYERALALLNEALDKDPKFLEAWHRSGLVYASMRQYAKAAECFEKGLALATDIRLKKMCWYDLGEVSVSVGNYARAKEVLGAYLNSEQAKNAKSDRARQLFNSSNFALESKAATGFELKMLSDTVNAFFMQYFPVLSADQRSLIFTRRLGDSDEFDEDLVMAVREGNRWRSPISISANINSRFNEGTCTLSADGRQLIFTSCVGRDGFGNCDLYESIKTGEVWSVPVNLGPAINSNAWESQPALTADGRTLYFVSDRRGGAGRRDIWVAQKDEGGKWTKAVNAGKKINSEFDEISPFIHANSRTLYFATNGLPGFGGFDLFYSERDSTNWSAPVNVGSPINNHQDQFSLYVSPDGSKAYYSLEEVLVTGQSKSRIVELVIPESRRVRYRSNFVTGVVTDAETNKPLKARLELIRLPEGQRISLVDSDSINGNYLMVLPQGGEYALYVNGDGYLFKSLHFNYEESAKLAPVVVPVKLDKLKSGTHVVLNNIFFDFNSYTLQSGSYPELNKVLELLNRNPALKIEIGGHTDNAGTAVYNQQLSEKRAKSVYEYLVQKGINKLRLTYKGYGDKNPVAENSTESGRSQNRRIEFTVIK